MNGLKETWRTVKSGLDERTSKGRTEVLSPSLKGCLNPTFILLEETEFKFIVTFLGEEMSRMALLLIDIDIIEGMFAQHQVTLGRKDSFMLS